MAIYVDLDAEGELGEDQAQLQQDLLAGVSSLAISQIVVGGPLAGAGHFQPSVDRIVRQDLNMNGITEALRCYPIVVAIVMWLDLNSLDNLSRTCRQIHDSLLLYRGSLLKRTLRCYKEMPPLEPEDNEMNWHYMGTNESYRRKGNCARDLVAECRRCAKPVCRNCTIRPPGPSTFRDRHRRLCAACTKAPLAALTRPPLRDTTPFGAEEMQRAICTCKTDRVWLCYPCGRNIIGADQDYRSIWRWRYQYEVLSGRTGISDANHGVVCGREHTCLAAKDVEQETDCDAADAREHFSLRQCSPAPTPSPSTSYTTGSPASSNMSLTTAGLTAAGAGGFDTTHLASSPHSGGLASGLRPGYARHEIEGIGGVVKTKLVRMVRVGASVPEWEDEKSKGQILEREVSGGRRSWCGWCWRVIPGVRDLPAKADSQIKSQPLSSDTFHHAALTRLQGTPLTNVHYNCLWASF